MMTILFDKIMRQAVAAEFYIGKVLSNIVGNKLFSDVGQGFGGVFLSDASYHRMLRLFFND